MNGKTHSVGGAIAGLIVVKAACESDFGLIPQSNIVYFVCLIAGVVGGLFPDIDLYRSTAGQKAGPFSFLVQLFFGHRSICHSPLFLAIMYLILEKICNIPHIFVVAFISGMYSHIVLDMLNKAGVPLFYPFPNRFWIVGIRTESVVETSLRYSLVVVAVFIAVSLFVL